MKKTTLQKWINQQRQRATQEKQEALRTARQDALSHCERWLYELTWATMRAPVRKRCEELRQEGQALVQKGAQRSETETARLAVVQASHAIYTLFLHKITPTVLQAEIEHDERRKVHTKEVFRQPGRVHHQELGKE
jgi:glutamyl-tRNA reductase